MSLLSLRLTQKISETHGRAVQSLAATLLLTLAACTTACNSTMQSFTPKTVTQTSQVRVSVMPDSASITSGGQLQFSALVRDTGDTAVTWSASAGTISASGLYSAPSVQEAQSVTVMATSKASPSSHAAVTIRVAQKELLTVTTQRLPAVLSGQSYSETLSAGGGVPPYQWSISSGALPPGLHLNSSGAIFGATAQTGTFRFTVGVKDVTATQTTHALALTVSPDSTGNFDGPAELPRVYLHTALADTPAPGRKIQVDVGGNLQHALNSATCGDTIELQAGATFNGTFTFPKKACDGGHWIIVRTGAPDSSLPAEGTRITPCYAGIASLAGRPALNCASTRNVMAKLVYVNKSGFGPVVFAAGANHYRLIGLEITRALGTGYVGELITPAMDEAASHIVLDRLWVHGTTHEETGRGFYMAGITSAAVVDSFFSDFHCVARTGSCLDSQAVSGGGGHNPAGPFKITNNFLEAAGENIIFGGGAATITPSDIEIRQNYLYKPMIWMAGQQGFIGGADGNPFIVKNHFELKNAQRVLFEGNIAENTWGGFSQAGYSLLLTPKSQAQGNTSVCPKCMVTDITIRYNKVSHAAAGMQIATVLSDAGGAAAAGGHYSIHDVTFYDISATTYNGGGPLFLLMNTWASNALNNVSINHITGLGDPNRPLLSVGDFTYLPKISGFTFTNNLVLAGGTPIWSTGGGSTNCAHHDVPITTINACFASYSFVKNAIIAPPAAFPPSKWPAGNFFPGDAAAVQFNNVQQNDYLLLASSPYKQAGTDGKDLGADIDALETATAGVR
jgi:hypothetical protein